MKNVLNKILALLSAALLLVGSTYADTTAPAIAKEAWEIVNDVTKDLTEEAKAAFEKATQDLLGYEYHLLGLVAKKSDAYCFLVREGVVEPDAPSSIGLLFVSVFAGEALITASHILADSNLEGGIQPVDGEVTLEANEEVKLAVEKALEGLVGVSYEPLAVYAVQVVAGTKYYLLAKSTISTPDAVSQLQTLSIFVDLQGAVELEELQTLELADMEVQFVDGDNMQIPDPFENHESLAEAAKKIGFSLTVPASLQEAVVEVYRSNESGKLLEIIGYQAGTAEEHSEEVYRIRKAEGQYDVSGDYTEYSVLTEVELNGINVLLRGHAEGYTLATWVDGEYSYSLSVDQPSTGNTQEKMLEWVKEIK